MKNSLRPQSVALIALACGLGTTLLAWYLAGRQAEAQSHAEFASQTQVAANALEGRIQRHIDLLSGLNAFALHESTPTRAQFHEYVAGLDIGNRFPGLQAVEFIRRVERRERDRFVRQVREDRSLSPSGFPGFDIHPEGERPEYWVIDFIEPMGENEAAFGLDLLTRSAAEAARRSRDSGEPEMTGRYRLAQEIGASFGLVIYLPVYAVPDPITETARREALTGFVNVVLRVDDLFTGLRIDPAFDGLDFALHDLGAVGEAPGRPSQGTLLFATSQDATAAAAQLAWYRWSPHGSQSLVVGGRNWHLDFHGAPELLPWLEPLPLLTLVAGLAVSLLLFGMLQTIARSRSEAVALARQATEELRTQLAGRRQLETVTRESNERLRAVIQAAPLAIVARDLDAVIRMWNPAAERMFGWSEDEALETGTSIVPAPLREDVAKLRHRAEAGEIIWVEDTKRLRRDGSTFDASVTIAPVYGADDKVIGTMVTVEDITRRKQAEQALRESEAHLRLAMEAAQMGMWYWEAGTDRFTYSDGLDTLFGRSVGAPLEDYRELQQRLHLDDRDLFAATLRHAIKQGSDFQVDYRVVWPDGSVHWIANRGQVHRGADGRAERVIGVAMDITDRKLAEQRIVHMAHHDALTGLPNRVLLRDRIQQAIAQAHRGGSQLAVLFIDLDRFKTINDSLGHQLGDRLLQSVASRILVCVREGDTVARVGGDEFVIVIPDLANAADASTVAAKILEVLANAFHLHGTDLHVAASIGISLYPNDGADAETLMRNADTAMYHAKDSGRGNFQFFTPHMNVAAQQRLLLENAMRRALENGEFEVHYQPLFDLRDRSITGFEALLRWFPPGGDAIPPSQFIAAAEESGLIVAIGEMVIREALTQARTWQAAGRSLVVAVNVSATQLARPSFVERLREAIHDSGLDPALVELEVTEGVIVEGAGEAREAIDLIAALGVGIAIDDFGTGYSGLAYLKRLPIDTVKIDQSFVRDLTVDPDDAAIVTAIVAMARSLGVDVVAEGVETEEQLAELQRLGCHRAQGYLLARPMSAAAVTRMLSRGALAAV